MHPALSVIFFTACSGAGYGVLFWVAMAMLDGSGRPWPLLLGVAIALLLATAGLLSSMLHLGKPGRAWRAFSQWRTSWLSREGVLAVLTYVPALGVALLLLPGVIAAHPVTPSPWMRLLEIVAAVALAACALATVACTAMIYASLKPIPAWTNGSVLPVYLVFALSGGALLLAALAAARGVVPGTTSLAVLALLALVPWPLKWRYWRDIDAPSPGPTRGDAVGLPGRQVRRFEGPTTEGNYITREMGFVLARRHARTLRFVAVLLFSVVPLACIAIAWAGGAGWVLAIAAIAAVAGAFVERWLFFAQARHMVTLYY